MTVIPAKAGTLGRQGSAGLHEAAAFAGVTGFYLSALSTTAMATV